MKSLVSCLVLATALRAQVAPPGEITPSTVVAKLPDGRNLTAAEIQDLMRGWPSNILQQFQQNPIQTLQGVLTVLYLAGEADKHKLADEQPWKEQIEASRAQILSTAMATYERNALSVPEEAVLAFYEKNKARYEQSKIKVIKIGFREPLPKGISQDDVKKAAEIIVQNEHAPNRSEDGAKTLAAEIIKQLRAGADFADLANKYSDDPESKAAGGDFGTVTLSGSYPEEMKKAVFALKPGEVGEPVRQPNALYIVRVQERSAPPIDQVRQAIISEIRDEHLKAYVVEVRKRMIPQLTRPEFFLPSGPPPAQPPKP